MSEEPISPEQLADAYWGNYTRSEELDRACGPRPYRPEAGDEIVAEGDGWRAIRHRRLPDEPEEPRTGLEWGWEMVNQLACGERWWDGFADDEQREPRMAPTIERLDLLELLAARAPDEEALGYLGADALEVYLRASPDVDAVDQAAQRSERFRKALAGVWFDESLPPEDVARLKRRSGKS